MSKVWLITGEPGGFRTNFAGSSTELREGRPEDDTTVGATLRFQRDYDGKQPGVKQKQEKSKSITFTPERGD